MRKLLQAHIIIIGTKNNNYYKHKMKKTKILLSALALLLAMQTSARKDCIVVEAGNAQSLLDAIDAANKQNADSASERIFILIPDGYYDLGERTLTLIEGHNIALVGQSTQGTVIRNAPDAKNEGIGKTAVLRNHATGLYLQDLTLRNDLDYYHSGSAGRAVCLQDRGTRTICKGVRMLSYQDTYYSDNETCQHYFEDSEIHGTVDFICGAGDVYFSRCTLVTEPRNADGTGRDVIAAPRTSVTKWGYVFDHCTIRNIQSEFYYGRGWHTLPRMALLHTRLESPEKLKQTRYDPSGMRTVQSLFYEYRTTDGQGNDITPKSNVVTFTLKDEQRSHETILSDAEAQHYQLKNIFPNWHPKKITQKLLKKTARMKAKAFRK